MLMGRGHDWAKLRSGQASVDDCTKGEGMGTQLPHGSPIAKVGKWGRSLKTKGRATNRNETYHDAPTEHPHAPLWVQPYDSQVIYGIGGFFRATYTFLKAFLQDRSHHLQCFPG